MKNFSVCPLASGSKGNSYLVKAGTHCGLIDLGLRLPRLAERLQVFSVRPEELEFVIVTHEHDDHVVGIPDLVKSYGTPIYVQTETARALIRKMPLSPADRIEFHDQGFTIGDLAFQPIRVSHDAAHPLGYTVRYDGREFTLATDLGYVPDALIKQAEASSTVFLESNHDLELLRLGAYPAYLKRRIIGERGHLSNEMCGKAMARMADAGVKSFVLTHLSEDNNLAELAYREAAAAVDGSGAEVFIAKQHDATGEFII